MQNYTKVLDFLIPHLCAGARVDYDAVGRTASNFTLRLVPPLDEQVRVLEVTLERFGMKLRFNHSYIKEAKLKSLCTELEYHLEQLFGRNVQVKLGQAEDFWLLAVER